jgi:non-heme chloroperoxidase
MDAQASSSATRTLETPDDVALSVQEWGNASGPEIVLIHGFSQSHLSWRKQYESGLAKTFRLIAYDLRGHAGSGKPRNIAYYRESRRWAQELHCVLEGMHLKRPVLVGWSYGGRVICDYLLSYGDGSLAGINFVCVTTKASPEWLSPGGKLLGSMASGPQAASLDIMLAFLHLCTAQPLPAEEFETLKAAGFAVPADVRSYMVGRPTPYEEALRMLRIPVLVTHGEKDEIVLPIVGRYTASVVPHAAVSFYPDVGHMPFWEDTTRFNRKLADFVKKVAL